MSRCFNWFPISGLGKPNLYHNLGDFTRMGDFTLWVVIFWIVGLKSGKPLMFFGCDSKLITLFKLIHYHYSSRRVRYSFSVISSKNWFYRTIFLFESSIRSGSSILSTPTIQRNEWFVNLCNHRDYLISPHYLIPSKRNHCGCTPTFTPILVFVLWNLSYQNRVLNHSYTLTFAVSFQKI